MALTFLPGSLQAHDWHEGHEGQKSRAQVQCLQIMHGEISSRDLVTLVWKAHALGLVASAEKIKFVYCVLTFS